MAFTRLFKTLRDIYKLVELKLSQIKQEVNRLKENKQRKEWKLETTSGEILRILLDHGIRVCVLSSGFEFEISSEGIPQQLTRLTNPTQIASFLKSISVTLIKDKHTNIIIG